MIVRAPEKDVFKIEVQRYNGNAMVKIDGVGKAKCTIRKNNRDWCRGRRNGIGSEAVDKSSSMNKREGGSTEPKENQGLQETARCLSFVVENSRPRILD